MTYKLTTAAGMSAVVAKDDGLFSLRNPSGSSRQITFTLNDALELPAGAAASYYLKSPWIDDAVDTTLLQPAGDEFPSEPTPASNNPQTDETK